MNCSLHQGPEVRFPPSEEEQLASLSHEYSFCVKKKKECSFCLSHEVVPFGETVKKGSVRKTSFPLAQSVFGHLHNAIFAQHNSLKFRQDVTSESLMSLQESSDIFSPQSSSRISENSWDFRARKGKTPLCCSFYCSFKSELCQSIICSGFSCVSVPYVWSLQAAVV